MKPVFPVLWIKGRTLGTFTTPQGTDMYYRNEPPQITYIQIKGSYLLRTAAIKRHNHRLQDINLTRPQVREAREAEVVSGWETNKT